MVDPNFGVEQAATKTKPSYLDNEYSRLMAQGVVSSPDTSHMNKDIINVIDHQQNETLYLDHLKEKTNEDLLKQNQFAHQAAETGPIVIPKCYQIQCPENQSEISQPIAN